MEWETLHYKMLTSHRRVKEGRSLMSWHLCTYFCRGKVLVNAHMCAWITPWGADLVGRPRPHWVVNRQKSLSHGIVPFLYIHSFVYISPSTVGQGKQ